MVSEVTIPTIKIYISDTFANPAVLLQVLSGVEEESIPYEIITAPDIDDAVALSYEGAFLSVLEVGIGIDSKGYLAVHTKSLPKENPLFKINYNLEREKLRGTCSNAARLVKGIPFFL